MAWQHERRGGVLTIERRQETANPFAHPWAQETPLFNPRNADALHARHLLFVASSFRCSRVFVVEVVTNGAFVSAAHPYGRFTGFVCSVAAPYPAGGWKNDEDSGCPKRLPSTTSSTMFSLCATRTSEMKVTWQVGSLYLVFMMIVQLVLLNLLVAIMSGTLSRLRGPSASCTPRRARLVLNLAPGHLSYTGECPIASSAFRACDTRWHEEC